MKQFSKNNAIKEINLKQNKNAYIKKVSISLACIILIVGIILYTFAKFESSSEEYTLINGTVKYDSCNSLKGHEWTYEYTGNYQTFTAECDGYYKVELWGAQGGDCRGNGGGEGAYTAGSIRLDPNQQLYVYVGQAGSSSNTLDIAVRFNGGGGVSGTTGRASGPTGGGATDVRVENGAWNNTTSLRSRLMVSAGGGGCYYGGPGGGLTGYDSTSSSYVAYSGKGAKQTAGGAAPSRYSACANGSGGCHQGTAGSFGQGGTGGRNSEETTSTGVVADGGGGGGSGYYGGSGASGLYNSGGMSGGSGSSFISGHNGCNAINASGSHTGQPYHFSGYYFINTKMIDGFGYEWTTTKAATSNGMPTHDGSSTMTGNSGNGYAKITYIGEEESINVLYDKGNELVGWNVSARSINSSHGTGSFTKNANTLSATIDSLQSKTAITNEKINLSNYSKIVVEYNLNGGATQIHEKSISATEAYVYFVGYRSTANPYVMELALASNNSTYPAIIMEDAFISQSSSFTFNIEKVYLME